MELPPSKRFFAKRWPERGKYYVASNNFVTSVVGFDDRYASVGSVNGPQSEISVWYNVAPLPSSFACLVAAPSRTNAPPAGLSCQATSINRCAKWCRADITDEGFGQPCGSTGPACLSGRLLSRGHRGYA